MTNKTWGGRFKKPLNPMASRFNASLSFDNKLYMYDIMGSKAHATMLFRQNLLSGEELESIINGLTEVEREIEQGIHPFDDMYEDIHMFIEQLLIKKIGEAGKKLHTGRSRNDQVALDLRLYTKDASSQIQNQLKTLSSTLEILSRKHANDIMPGYTHLQQAQPVTLGRYFDAYFHMFSRDISRMNDWYERMNFCPLGAGALAGSSLPLDREYVAKELGFYSAISNTMDAVSDRDYVVELCHTVALIMMHLSRLSEDLILWATQEFSFLLLDDAFATGSSLMPNKKNPDILELIRGKSGRVYGNLMAILTTMKALPLSYNKDMQEDKERLFDTVDTALACLSIMGPFLESVTFNVSKMADAVDRSHLNATRLLEDLVVRGVPFRDAHHKVGVIVAEAIEKGCSLEEAIPTDWKV